jgi:hypothetical protein
MILETYTCHIESSIPNFSSRHLQITVLLSLAIMPLSSKFTILYTLNLLNLHTIVFT